MFISFEGIDGSGKSTQIRLLAEQLEADGRDVVVAREPGGTPLGEEIREILLGGSHAISDRAELLLFSVARAELVEKVIRPALLKGAIVLADRFFDSTVAYQGGGRRIAEPAWVRDFQMFVTGGLLPDVTFFLDVDPDTAARRKNAQDLDRMEGAGVRFFERVRAAYLEIATGDPERVVVFDGRREANELNQAISARVEAYFSGH